MKLSTKPSFIHRQTALILLLLVLYGTEHVVNDILNKIMHAVSRSVIKTNEKLIYYSFSVLHLSSLCIYKRKMQIRYMDVIYRVHVCYAYSELGVMKNSDGLCVFETTFFYFSIIT